MTKINTTTRISKSERLVSKKTKTTNYDNDKVSLRDGATEKKFEKFQNELKDYHKASNNLKNQFNKMDGYMEHLSSMDNLPVRSGASNEEMPEYGAMYYGEMPTPEELEKAFDKMSTTPSTDPGNSETSECVVKFKELFESGTVKPGDIILIAKPSKGEFHPLSDLVPGDFSHVAVYLGKNSRGQRQSIDAWHPAAPFRDIDWWPKSYNKWSIIRPVKPDGTELSDEERTKVIEFAKKAEGCKYNFMWPTNKVALPISKETTKFYCSQLAWASYFFTTGIDIDQHPGFHPKYAWGVAPQELHDSPNVKIIGEYTKPKESKE